MLAFNLRHPFCIIELEYQRKAYDLFKFLKETTTESKQ